MGFRKSCVSIVKCKQHDEVMEPIRKSLDLIGGIESIVSAGDVVLIKPNLVFPKPYLSGATTNPHIIKALVNLCKDAGAGEIIIGEGSAVGQSASKAFEVCGIKQIADEHECTLIDFARDEYQLVLNSGASIFKRLRIPQIFQRVNVIINVPVMKTHDALGVTLGLKNMKGIIHVTDKKRFHKWGLAQAVVDLNKIFLPELTLMDGTIGMEGNGPAEGDPVGLDLILASTDTVACDRVASEIMGFDPDEIEYIKMAGEQGLGNFDLSEIQVVGERIIDVKRPFKRTSIDTAALKEMRINLLSCDACSGCSQAVMNYIVKLQKNGTIEKLKEHTFIYGQSAYIPEEIQGKVVRVGTCTRNLTDNDYIYIPGCPPHPHHIDEKLKSLILEDVKHMV